MTKDAKEKQTSENTFMINFVNQFKKIDLGDFFGFTIFNNGEGFSLFKHFNKNQKKEKLSLIKFFILDQKEKKDIVSIGASAIYGEKIKEGIAFTENKLNEPLNIESIDEYFFNINTLDIYKKNKKISQIELINDFYYQHIKITKIPQGLWLRVKVFFYKVLMKNLFICLKRLFYYLLFLLNGDKYDYISAGKIEKLNGKIISSRFDKVGVNYHKDIQEKKGKEMKFFGYEANIQIIIFYSAIHILIYIFCVIFEFQSSIVINFFNNTFLTLLYVVFSLWFFDAILPIIFKWFIKFNSELAFKCLIKMIKV